MPRKLSTKQLAERALKNGPIQKTKYTYLKDLRLGTFFKLPGETDYTWKLITIGSGSAKVLPPDSRYGLHISLETEVIPVPKKRKKGKTHGKKKANSKPRKRTKRNRPKANQTKRKKSTEPKKARTVRGNKRGNK